MSIQDALDFLGIKITKFKTYKTRGIITDMYGNISIEKLAKIFIDGLSVKVVDYYSVIALAQNRGKFLEAITEYADELGVIERAEKEHVSSPQEMPKELQGLTLNLDMTYDKTPKFFLTDQNNIISRYSGNAYIRLLGMKEDEAMAIARRVIPEYLPRNPTGVFDRKNVYGQVETVLNTYIPPKWMGHTNSVSRVESGLPKSFMKLVDHLFPLEIEKEYLFNWMWHSLYERSYVYLVLCGAPGSGKNRLKLIMRALHGQENSVDGKRSTLTERFNSQLSDSTLSWFDELSYTSDMENTMKELQNDSISIERKGVDATRSTKIYSSIVISNNKPRDNFISFDSRKFCPLVVTRKRLETSMTPDEIATLTAKVEDQSSPTYSVAYIARIGEWIRKNGKSNKWPNLEYRGPMFYKLAHTSMTRWQKKAVTILLDAIKAPPARATYDKKKGFLWSTLQELSQKKNGDRSLQFPDNSTIKYFFDIFQDSKGNKAFKTIMVKDSIMGDFYVRPIIEGLKIVTEADVMGEIENVGEVGKRNTRGKSDEYYDL